MQRFKLPPAIADLVEARNAVREHYRSSIHSQVTGADLSFTLDGNLVGDIGEAIAVEHFGIQLVSTKSTEGIDGYAPDGKTTVQVKATGTGRGPAFRNTPLRADHLLFFDLDFENCEGTVVFNGPEHYAVALLPGDFSGQRLISRRRLEAADARVRPSERLQYLSIESSTPKVSDGRK